MNDLVKENADAAVRRSECVVMKFGGTSVEDAPAIRRVSQLVKRRLRHHPVVVASALAKVTDQLLAVGKAAAAGQSDAALGTVQQLRQRHEDVARGLVEGELYERLWGELEDGFHVLEDLVRAIAAAADFSPRMQDRFLGMGEILSSKIVHAALLKAGFDVVWVDAKECVVTDAAHTRATPLWEETNERLESMVLPLVHAGRIPVMGGFIGATRDGIPTTLGRGGSDYSAAIVGAGLHASRIEIWTDVDGVMTTDPNLCPEARRVTSMSFHEAAELAYFGAKVLHPATLAPAMRRDIPVWVLNSRNPEGGGTEIVAHACDGGRVKAITAKRGIAVVDVEPVRWLAPELMREVFEVFERHHLPLDLLSASRGSLSLLVSSTAALPAIAEDLKGLAHVRWENHKALVCLVGEKVRRRPEIASQVFHAISDIEMRMICQGASERNISFLVDESRAEEAVRRLHDVLFAAPPARLSAGASHTMCQVGEAWN
jgi:aspartate kinase